MQAPARATGPPSAHGLAGFIVGFEEIGGWDDTELLALPSAAERQLAGYRLGAGVVGLAGQLVVRPVGTMPNIARTISSSPALARSARYGRAARIWYKGK